MGNNLVNLSHKLVLIYSLKLFILIIPVLILIKNIPK